MSGLKQTFLTRLGDIDTTAKEVLGILRYEGNKVYKYVQILNSVTTAGAVGNGVVYFAATGYAANRVCVRYADGDATMPVMAGVLAGAPAGVAGTAEYGWIQIKGPATLTTAVTSGVAGQTFKATATNDTETITTLVTDNAAGISTNGTTGVILNCPF